MIIERRDDGPGERHHDRTPPANETVYPIVGGLLEHRDYDEWAEKK